MPANYVKEGYCFRAWGKFGNVTIADYTPVPESIKSSAELLTFLKSGSYELLVRMRLSPTNETVERKLHLEVKSAQGDIKRFQMNYLDAVAKAFMNLSDKSLEPLTSASGSLLKEFLSHPGSPYSREILDILFVDLFKITPAIRELRSDEKLILEVFNTLPKLDEDLGVSGYWFLKTYTYHFCNKYTTNEIYDIANQYLKDLRLHDPLLSDIFIQKVQLYHKIDNLTNYARN
jgi:hypothetical protein